MSFGLLTLPSTHQRLTELALTGLQWAMCLIYLDDIIIFIYDFDNHLDCLD